MPRPSLLVALLASLALALVAWRPSPEPESVAQLPAVSMEWCPWTPCQIDGVWRCCLPSLGRVPLKSIERGRR
jgi:hypothetical protein